MNKERFEYLLFQYLNNCFTESELIEFLDLLKTNDLKDLDQLVDQQLNKHLKDNLAAKHKFEKDSTFAAIQSHIKQKPVSEETKHYTFPIRWVAASVAILLSITLFWVYTNIDSQSTAYVIFDDIELPEASSPTVTLADGTNYCLSEMDANALLNLGISLTNNADGSETFQVLPSTNGVSEQRTFHVPKGTSSVLMMPDGSKVWLNSGSKLRYPSEFSKNIRQVELEGEAYFEIAHNKASPFVVKSAETHIKVLGTEFNVSNYLEADKTFTTLVSGKVEINNNRNKTNLSPGLQSITSKNSSKIQTKKVNTKMVTSWKEGYFNFDNDDIRTVLTKIKSWYDIQGFEIKDETSDQFTGSILRTHKLSHLLAQLEKTSNYKFKIKEGRVQAMGRE